MRTTFLTSFAATLALLLAPAVVQAEAAMLLTHPDVTPAREAMADSLTRLANQFPFAAPPERTKALSEMAVVMDDLVAHGTDFVEGNLLGSEFLARGTLLATCMRAVSDGPLHRQVAVLRAAADYWRMISAEPLPSNLCD